MAKLLVPFLVGLLIAGCGSPQTTGEVPKLDPKDQKPSASQTAERKQIDGQEVAKILDLKEYPGAEQVENIRLVSPDFAPDEIRLELTRRAKDAPAKVVKYFETALSTTAGGQPGHQEIFGQTPRTDSSPGGDYVRVHVDAEGSGSKYTISVISYNH